MRATGSVYMRWAKEHAGARYNLANSGLLGCGPGDFEIGPEDLQINGANADGYPPLLAAIAGRYGVAAEQVVLARGTSGANFLAFAGLVEPEDEVLVEGPAYEPILAALAFLGARIRRFERRAENGWRPDPRELQEALAGGRVRLVVLTNPHNPSGVLLSTTEMVDLARRAGEAGTRLLVDEVYLDSWAAPPAEAPVPHVHLGPHVLATSSLTKSYGLSGLRCGWVLAAPEVATRLRRVHDFMAAVGPLPAEALATAAFRQLGRLAERARGILDPNRALVHAFLEEHRDLLDCVVPGGSMTVFPRLRNEEDAWALHDRLRRTETSIVPGQFFEAPRHFRLGFAVKTEDVRQGLGHLSRALREPG